MKRKRKKPEKLARVPVIELGDLEETVTAEHPPQQYSGYGMIHLQRVTHVNVLDCSKFLCGGQSRFKTMRWSAATVVKVS